MICGGQDYETTELFEERAGAGPAAMPALPPQFEMPQDLHRNMVRGTPVAMGAESVTHQNWLQIAGSYRYVYAQSGDFSLVEDVLRESPQMSRGSTPEISAMMRGPRYLEPSCGLPTTTASKSPRSRCTP